MAEKITNGSFTTNLTGWTNYGTTNFYWSSDMARAISDETQNVRYHKIRQSFSVSGTVSAAVLNAQILWDLVHKLNHGHVTFTVYLRKPDNSLVELASHTEEATADKVGNEYVADNLDVAANFDQSGTYYLELWADCLSSWTAGLEYFESYGYYDNVSLTIVTRQFKTVVEAVGGGEVEEKKSSLSTLDGAGLGETYSTIPSGSDAALLRSEKAGLQEGLAAAVSVEKADGAGLGETLTRTYGYRQRTVTASPEGAGMGESLVARWQSGNFTSERDILAPADAWEDVAKVSTDWEDV